MKMKKLLVATAITFSLTSLPAMAERDGASIYNTNCIACHMTGIAGAPKKDDAAAWEARLASAGSLENLVALAKKGKGAMPPMGTCMNCSDAELTNVVKFITGK